MIWLVLVRLRVDETTKQGSTHDIRPQIGWGSAATPASLLATPPVPLRAYLKLLEGASNDGASFVLLKDFALVRGLSKRNALY